MKIILILIINSIIFSSSLFTARAETPLHKDDIRHFMNAMKPLQDLGQKYDFNDRKKNPVATTAGQTEFSPMSQSLKEVKNHAAYAEFKTIIQNAGFSSPRQWATVGDRVMRAYMSLKTIAKLTPEKIQEIQVSIEAVKKNEYLSPESKKQLLGSMKFMINMKSNLSEENKADMETLKPYLAKLERLFEERK